MEVIYVLVEIIGDDYYVNHLDVSAKLSKSFCNWIQKGRKL